MFTDYKYNTFSEFKSCLKQQLYHTLIVILILLPFIQTVIGSSECNVDPVHDLQTSLTGNLVVPNFGYTDTTNVMGDVACRDSTYNYPPGLSMKTDVFSNNIDTEVPWENYILKKTNTSFLKIEINSAFKCSGGEVACRWEVLVNDYHCDPPAYHEIYNAPTLTHEFRNTFTAICKKWTYGGNSTIPAGYYKITLVESSLNAFDGSQWQFPTGTLPHGSLPAINKGAPVVGDGYYATFSVEEVEDTPYRTVFQERVVHHTTSSTARQFQFTKNEAAASTALKITVYDNFRCHTREAVNFGLPTKDTCTFEVRIDGSSCTPGPVQSVIMHNEHSDLMHGKTFVGICTGISAGTHTLSISITGTGIPYMGMISTTSTIYIEEISTSLVGSQYRTFLTSCSHTPSPALSSPLCFPNIEPDRNCILACRSVTFTKPLTSSITKIQLYDTLSCSNAGGNGASSCDIEFRVDGQSCTDPGPMKFNHFDDTTTDNYRAGIGYVGYCRQWNNQFLTAGTHTLTLFRRILSQNPAATNCATCPTNVLPSIGEGVTGFIEISFYQPETITTCVDCNCNGHGTCQSNGVCSCNVGFTGSNCSICDTGYEGDNCDICTPGKYYLQSGACVPCDCSGNGYCDASGVCQCNIGYTNANCDSCATGYEGLKCFQCSSGYLREGRYCLSACSSGYYQQGQICVSKCYYGYYLNGGVCISCGCNEQGSYSSGCDSTGQCPCKTGYSGNTCT